MNVIKTLENTIENYFEKNKTLSKEELVFAIGNDFPTWSEGTIKVYLSKLKKAGRINNPSRGTYSIANKQTFNPEINQNLKKTFNKIQKEYPYVTFCIWNSSWLNDVMRHQPFKQYIVIEVEKEAAEQVFNSITGTSKNVFLNPDEEIFERYIANLDEVIIVKNLVSESPLIKINKIKIPTLEKLLVDMLIDKELFAAQQGELEFIFETAFDKYPINKLKMKRYALRRNREQEIERMLNSILAKNDLFAKN
jgi:hypothetical protein